MIERELLIVGHPRSGTGYAKEVCQAYGLDVGHESLGEFGISSWLFTPISSYRPPFHQFEEPRSEFNFKHTIAIIRNPIDIICSTAFTENEHSEYWRAAHVFIDSSADQITRACQSVVGWYKLINSMGVQVYKIEDIEEYIKSLSGSEKQFEPNKKYNSRDHQSLKLDQLHQIVSTGVFNEVIKLSKSYNYV